MNNYDDIKRFKEKLNMEGIDYKEIAENNPHSATASNWAIMQQVASSDEPFHPLEHGHTTQPTPAPISNKEFILSALDIPPSAPHSARQQTGNDVFSSTAMQAADSPPTPPQPFASPLMSALSKVLPVAREQADNAKPAAPAGATAFHPDNIDQPQAIARQPASLESANPFSSPPPYAGASLFNAADQGRRAAPSPFMDNGLAAQPVQHGGDSSLFGPTDQEHGNQGPAFGRPIAANHRDRDLSGFVASTPVNRQQPGLFNPNPRDQQQPGLFNPTPSDQQQPGLFGRQNADGPTMGREMPFNQLFNRKSHQNNGALPGRDMPLSLLLENIALCR